MPHVEATLAATTRLFLLMPQESHEFPFCVSREWYAEMSSLVRFLTQQLGPDAVHRMIDRVMARIEEAQQRMMVEQQEPELPFALKPEP